MSGNSDNQDLHHPGWGGLDQSKPGLLRENPLRKVLERLCILGVDNLVIFLRTVSQFDFRRGRHVLDYLLLTVGLAFVFCRNLLVGGAFLVFVDGVALGTVILFRQSLRRFLIKGKSSAGERQGGDSETKGENGAESRIGFQSNTPLHLDIKDIIIFRLVDWDANKIAMTIALQNTHLNTFC